MSKFFNSKQLSQLIRRQPRRILKPTPSSRRAAVLIPIVNRNNKPHLLFTKRSEMVGSHKGQVSFPGGRTDGNETPIETALRETEEEIGIPSSDIEVVAELHDCHSYYMDVVTPVVGIVKTPFGMPTHKDIVDFDSRFHPLILSESEIDDVLMLSIDELVDPKHVEFDNLGYRAGHVPVFKAGRHDVWGLTAVMVRDFLLSIDEWTLDTPKEGGRIIQR